MADSYHEPFELLDAQARDLHRALTSLKEEIEAVDWYNQRVVLCADRSLAKVLTHNRDEEIEHACMTLEWLRRNMPGWDAQLREYLFSAAEDITAGEAHAKTELGEEVASSLGIGNMKGREQ